MRLSFASGILCAGLFAVSCVQRDYNKAETKAVTDTKTIVKNPDGTFTVTCDWGAVEKNVTAEQFNKNDVCKVTQINPKAFNAFHIWRDGQGSEVLDYPQGYDVATNSGTVPDGVFYVEVAAYWKRADEFSGVPTEGAKVVNDVLEYPSKNVKQLKLKFTKISEKKMSHSDAVTFCKNQGLRLPTAREIFDFCAAGVTEPNYGPNFKYGRYPQTARCGQNTLWSASVYSSFRNNAWLFYGNNGVVSNYDRYVSYGVRCVGGP
jgi:hypothetical protein